MDAEKLAEEMLDDCRRDEQSARRVPSDSTATAIRRELRRLARDEGLRIRTGRMDDTVVVVRLDAKIWTDDAATMRRKLTPK